MLSLNSRLFTLVTLSSCFGTSAAKSPAGDLKAGRLPNPVKHGAPNIAHTSSMPDQKQQHSHVDNLSKHHEKGSDGERGEQLLIHFTDNPTEGFNPFIDMGLGGLFGNPFPSFGGMGGEIGPVMGPVIVEETFSWEPSIPSGKNFMDKGFFTRSHSSHASSMSNHVMPRLKNLGLPTPNASAPAPIHLDEFFQLFPMHDSLIGGPLPPPPHIHHFARSSFVQNSDHHYFSPQKHDNHHHRHHHIGSDPMLSSLFSLLDRHTHSDIFHHLQQVQRRRHARLQAQRLHQKDPFVHLPKRDRTDPCKEDVERLCGHTFEKLHCLGAPRTGHDTISPGCRASVARSLPFACGLEIERLKCRSFHLPKEEKEQILKGLHNYGFTSNAVLECLNYHLEQQQEQLDRGTPPLSTECREAVIATSTTIKSFQKSSHAALIDALSGDVHGVFRRNDVGWEEPFWAWAAEMVLLGVGIVTLGSILAALWRMGRLGFLGRSQIEKAIVVGRSEAEKREVKYGAVL